MRKIGLATNRLWFVVAAACVALVVAVSLPATSVAVTRRAAVRMPMASGHLSKVIVLLRDRPAGMAVRSHARTRTLHSEQAPLVSLLRSHGAEQVSGGRVLPYLIANVSASQLRALRSNPVVVAVEPNSVVPLAAPTPLPSVFTGSTGSRQARVRALDSSNSNPAAICGTAKAPERDPEAINVINAPEANALGYDGAGVTVAYVAGQIDTTIPDFQRNAQYASAGSPTGSPVVRDVNFAGDPAGTTANSDADLEAFLDASSIGAQGNTVYNLDDYINSSHSLPSPCDITVTGAAPGANVMGLDVFSENYDTTESSLIQAIDYAVANNVKVLNESFGSNNFPDTSADATRIVDNDAVAAGVTVVVSSGDAGVTSTTGSPATDSNLISVGATTTFREYEQGFYGGVNAIPSNGTWIDNNIASFSSGGFAQSGANTVDLVAPGDSNWIDCSTASQFSAVCTNLNNEPSGVVDGGGTSESAPLVASAAADVIQAYASSHHGADPSPALVKQILMSTATDIDSPAEQQGAGLLNVLAAVKEAVSMPGSRSGATGSGLLMSPNQINITQNPGQSTSQNVSVTNTSTRPVTVDLSTRTFTHAVGNQTGSFCLNPSSTYSACGPPTANTLQIWSGVTEVYQLVHFRVPDTGGVSRLDFSADYPDTGQSSLLHVALYDPSGAYTGYSSPQGLADYANIQISTPKAGEWTAVFFTELDGATPGGVGTSGNIQWQATTYQASSAGSITPSTLNIAPGATANATFTATSPNNSGDAAQSIVLSTEGGATNTIPVTVRTLVPVGPNGGFFSGVLTGGNGRAGAPAQESTYEFQVPAGEQDLDVSAAFADSNDGVIAYLRDPEGQTVGSSSNVTLNSTATSLIGTNAVNVYKDSPEAGTWYLTLDWLNPVSGSELAEPFSGYIGFNQVDVGSNLPQGSATQLRQGRNYTFDVRVHNTAQTPEAFFLDPRTDQEATFQLPDLNGSDQDMTLPLPAGLTFPVYVVPTDTTEIETSITGSGPVTYDIEPFPGDPDLSPVLAAPGVTESQGGDSASLDYTPGGEVSTGLWYLNPSEIGPYGSSGATPITASDTFDVVTPAFDPTVTPSTGDLWSAYAGLSSTFDPVYLEPGQSASIPVTITPTANPGARVSGAINVDDTFEYSVATGEAQAGGDELASIPYSYRVGH